jgi:predicted  nucleic acid-binding Zn-ribbon protein
MKLQELDSQIYKLNEEIESKPKEIEALQEAFEEKKKRLSLLEKAYLDAQKEKKEKELEFAAKEENTKKLQSQLYQLKTNKEYNIMLQQINDTKADASLAEDKIIEAMEKIDKTKTSLDYEKGKIGEEEKIFLAEKKKVEDLIKEMDGSIAQFLAQRNQTIPDIDNKILSQYERILHNRDGLAICAVKNNTCAGCNMFVPAQVINLIQMYDKMVTCEVCNRILVIPNE